FQNQNYLSSSIPHVFTFKNYQVVPITFNSISEIQGDSEDFILDTTIGEGYTLAPGATASFAITFSPHNLYLRSGFLDISTSLFDVTIEFSGLAIRDMELTYPNGGEELASGNTFKVRWIRSGHPNIVIKFSPDNGANWITPFLTATPIDDQLESYYCTVPNVNSTQCIVRIEWDEDGSHYDQSDAPFTVSNTSDQSVISVTQPSSANLCLLRGNTYQIKWTTTNTPLISIDLSIDDGATWSPIAERVNSLNLPATSNVYDWIVPNIMTTAARIRVRNWANSAHYDISKEPFIIGALELNSFNNGGLFYNDWSQSYEHGIYFTAINIPTVNIKYSLNGGSSWLSCAGVVSSSNYPVDSGIYYWKLPGDESTTCLIRIEKSGDSSVYVLGNQVFELRNKVRFRNFGGGEYINPNTTVTARWRLMNIEPQTLVTLQYGWGTSYPSTWFNANVEPIPVGNLNYSAFMNTTGQSNVWYRLVESGSECVLTRSTSKITVTTKFINLVFPDGEDTLFAGDTVTIQWDQDGCTSFDIFLTTDDGDSWTKLNTTTVSATENSFLWTVPSLVSDKCSIKIQHTGSTLSYMVKQSEQNFTITIPPVIDFSSDVAGGLAPVAVQFTDLSQPGIGTIVAWQWAFGDGGVSAEQSPLHHYITPGVYSVSLQVTNSVGAYYSLEKENYINVLAVGALITYTPPSVSFMDVPHGQLTAPTNVTITNSGNAPLSLSSAHFKLQGSPFSVTNLNTPFVIQPGASHIIGIRFMPSSFNTVSDSLVIINNSVNKPQGGLKITGRAASQEPMPPQNLVITLQDQDVHLAWDPVTETISGLPITTSYYAVFYNGSIDEEGGSFYYHGWTTDTSYIHFRIAQFSPNMFYKVYAITEYRGENILEILESSSRQTTEKELLDKLKLSRKALKM
ncbi:MAG: choice-of-anchor D domain-containing protein, partial [Candidatus Cloacimonetes bacterium]|nr:choice-of-anchor D domain-containing protein [Candidatus Cloacimonadota bacterium]